VAGTEGLERRELIAAAHTVVVVAAYFEAFREHVGEEFYDALKLTEDKKKVLIAKALEPVDLFDSLYAAEVPAPAGAVGFEDNVHRVTAWFEKFGVTMEDFARACAGGEAGNDAGGEPRGARRRLSAGRPLLKSLSW
jgi:hypothetical protein